MDKKEIKEWIEKEEKDIRFYNGQIAEYQDKVSKAQGKIDF